MQIFDVILHNEDESAPILYDVRAADVTDALAEAWRQYRELSYIDGEQPPDWTFSVVQPALGRVNGERPTVTHNPSGDWYHPGPDHVEGIGPEANFIHGKPPASAVVYRPPVYYEDASRA